MSNAKQATSAAGWKKAAVHTIVLPSGAVVEIRIPDISALIQSGELPQNLLQEALKLAKDEDQAAPPTAEDMAREIEFKNLVCLATVVKPEITAADLDPKSGIPTEDKDMLVAFAMRQAEFDAEGNHISGLDRSDKFRKFRGIANLYEDVEGLPGS